MNRNKDTQDLIQNGYRQGDTDSSGTCEDCEVTCNGLRGWWYRVSYEYDEWDCRCRKCAIVRIHQYDDFDMTVFEQVHMASNSETPLDAPAKSE